MLYFCIIGWHVTGGGGGVHNVRGVGGGINIKDPTFNCPLSDL